MGSGKTTVGRRLAARTGAVFVDLDARVERMFGQTVAELSASRTCATYRRATRFVAGLLMVAACGRDQEATSESSGSTGSTEAAVDSSASTAGGDALLEELAHAYCDQVLGCGCAAINPDGFASSEQCVEAVLASLRGILAAGEEARLIFDPNCLETRFARFGRVGCDPGWSAAGPREWCKVHYGERALGESCYGSDNATDNAEGDDCQRGLACFSGVCVEAPETDDEEYAPGEPCYDEHPYCFEGFCLDAGDGERACVLSPGAGEPCLVGTCAPGLLCNGDDLCVVAGGLGEACDAEAPCDPCLECEATQPGACSFPAPVPVGGACNEDLDCVEGAWCNELQGQACSTDPVACWTGGAQPRVSVVSRSRKCAHLL